MHHWSLIDMANCPFLSPFKACSLFPGGSLKSSMSSALSMYSNFRRAFLIRSAGSLLLSPSSNKSRVSLSANVLIVRSFRLVNCNMYRDTLQKRYLNVSRNLFLCCPGFDEKLLSTSLFSTNGFCPFQAFAMALDAIVTRSSNRS